MPSNVTLKECNNSSQIDSVAVGNTTLSYREYFVTHVLDRFTFNLYLL